MKYRDHYTNKYNEQKDVIRRATDIVLYGNSFVACLMKTVLSELKYNKRVYIFDKGKFIDDTELLTDDYSNVVVLLCSLRKTVRVSMEKDSRIFFPGAQIVDYFPIYYIWATEILMRDCDSDMFANTVHECEIDSAIPNIDSINTLFCNLNCKECSNGIQYRNNKRKIPVDSMEYYLRKITDKLPVLSCNFQGGEVFTDSGFDKVLNCHAKNPRICFFTVSTNGAILPNDNIFSAIKKIGAVVRISDYGELSSQKERIMEKCSEFKIPCFCYPRAEKWRKFGELKRRNRSEDELKEISRQCFFGTHDLMFLENRFYCCMRTLVGSILEEDNEDIIKNTLDLDSDFTLDDLKAIISGKNLWKMCDYCDWPMNIIDPAEQS